MLESLFERLAPCFLDALAGVILDASPFRALDTRVLFECSNVVRVFEIQGAKPSKGTTVFPLRTLARREALLHKIEWFAHCFSTTVL